MVVLTRGGGEFDKRKDKEFLKRLYNIYKILTPPPKVIVLSFNCGNVTLDATLRMHYVQEYLTIVGIKMSISK